MPWNFGWRFGTQEATASRSWSRSVATIVAKGAYEAALKLKPGANLVLAHRARVIARARGNPNY